MNDYEESGDFPYEYESGEEESEPIDEIPESEDLPAEEWGPVEHPDAEAFQILDEIPEGEKPIEMRTSEAEKLYANLLMVTDFEEEFIEEMLEFEPDESSKIRIEELRRKRREMKEMALSPEHQPKIIPL